MKQYVVDAFSKEVFHGNQAAVCVMEQWIPEELMMNITKENNFSETAFTVKEGDAYHLRWFTPGGEIDLCGHATLGTAYVILNFYETEAEQVNFQTRSGLRLRALSYRSVLGKTKRKRRNRGVSGFGKRRCIILPYGWHAYQNERSRGRVFRS